jgi:hypothetical protein
VHAISGRKIKLRIKIMEVQELEGIEEVKEQKNRHRAGGGCIYPSPP